MCVCMYVDKRYVRVHMTNVHEGVGICLSHVHTHAYPRVRSSHVRIYPTFMYACHIHGMLVTYMWIGYACVHVTSVNKGRHVCVHVTNVHEGVGIRLSHVHTHAYPHVRSSHVHTHAYCRVRSSYVRIYPTFMYACYIHVTSVHECM